MKWIYFILMFGVLTLASFKKQGQNEEENGINITVIKEIETTSVKDQNSSGTCWSFAGMSFLETEMIRKGHKPVDLSEMYVVRNCYIDKAKKYVRMHGKTNFGGGGAYADILYVFKNYGLMPEKEYNGLNYGEKKHVHGELDNSLQNYTNGIIQNKNEKLSQSWLSGFTSILDAYLGEVDSVFRFNGKKYTPKSFAKKVVGLNPDDYVNVTSFTHHPFYSAFILEVPDNWLWEEVYNVPLDEFKQIIDNAIYEEYSIAWAGDVSEKGFSHKKGYAVVPITDDEEISGLERAKWENMSKEEKEDLFSFNRPVPERTITQQMRQEAFDNYETQDDHGMHIVGIAKDQQDKKYYKVKNSWDADNVFNGYLYASEAYILYKTTSIMVNKNAIPEHIRKKLDI